MNKLMEPVETGTNSTERASEQATELRGILMALGRNLLSVDDLTLDLPIRQLRICLVLSAHSGSMSEISREVGISLSAMTQVADRLERAGLVERVFQGTDRRVRHLQLTERGRQLMRGHQETQLARMANLLERLTKSQAREALDALKVLVQASQPNRQEATD